MKSLPLSREQKKKKLWCPVKEWSTKITVFPLINLLFHTDLWLEMFWLSWRSSNKIVQFISGSITPGLWWEGSCCHTGMTGKGGAGTLHLLLTFVNSISGEARINGEKCLFFWKHLVKIPQLKSAVPMSYLRKLNCIIKRYRLYIPSRPALLGIQQLSFCMETLGLICSFIPCFQDHSGICFMMELLSAWSQVWLASISFHRKD